jgi:small subunit ribosomal protein S16
MSVTIRLARIGKKNSPAYKVVVSNTKSKRNGKYLDVLGHFNPSHNPSLLQIDKENMDSWVKKGALITTAVDNLVKGNYNFEPYTRQNEKKESKPGSDAPKE